MISNDWTFKGNKAWHIPCNSPAYSSFWNRTITCGKCKEQLPECLELPASVFGSYNEMPDLLFTTTSSFYLVPGGPNSGIVNLRLNNIHEIQEEE